MHIFLCIRNGSRFATRETPNVDSDSALLTHMKMCMQNLNWGQVQASKKRLLQIIIQFKIFRNRKKISARTCVLFHSGSSTYFEIEIADVESSETLGSQQTRQMCAESANLLSSQSARKPKNTIESPLKVRIYHVRKASESQKTL